MTIPDREWVPTAFMLAASEDFVTDIAFSPRQMLRNESVSYTSEICVYDPETGKPCHRLKSDPIGLGDCFRTSSEEFRSTLRPDRKFFYCEAFNSASAPPADSNVALPSNLHYRSKSGKLQGDLGSNYIFGAPRKAFKGEFYYDHFPYGKIFAGTSLRVFLLNPYVRPSAFRIFLTSASRANHEITKGTISGKTVESFEMEIPEEFMAHGQAIVVAGELKINVLYGIVDAKSGIMYGLDHGHPFLMEKLSH